VQRYMGCKMADIRGVSHTVPAVRMIQDGVSVYVAAVPAYVIAEIGVVNEYDPDKDAGDETQGYQRAPSRQHAAKIKSYLLDPTQKRLLPSATLLSSRTRLTFRRIGDSEVGELELVRPIYVVDGQHRSLGLQLAAEEDDSVGDFTIPVVILDSVDRNEEIRQFYTINKTAKGVRSDLADALLKSLGALNDPSRQWLDTAIDVSEHLNGMRGGPWKDLIRRPNGSAGIVSQKSMTESLKQITSSVLRGVDAVTVAAAVNNFWEALRTHMPEAFAEPKGYVLQKSNGVFVWNEVASEYFRRRMISDRDLSTARAVSELAQLEDHVDSEFWATRSKGGIAPNYSGRGGMHALALEIISELPESAGAVGSIHV
jgi:DGQHR domain-containing protein